MISRTWAAVRRDFALERLGQGEHGGRGLGLAGPGGGGQGLEAAGPIGADPAVEGVAGHPDALAVGAGVVLPGQVARRRPLALVSGASAASRMSE